MKSHPVFPPFPVIWATGKNKPVLVVIAGPNGAGKTTFYEERIAHKGFPFINADLITKEMEAKGEKVTDHEAAKIAETRRREYVLKKRSFCLETVFSDMVGSKRQLLNDAQKNGFYCFLIFIGLDQLETSRARVFQRVSEGGHNVPDQKLKERFPRTFDNLRKAIGFVDQTILIDNSSFDNPYRLIATCVSGQVVQLFPPIPIWARDVLPLGWKVL
ncbi:MAG: zeta toxin family protein [Deltaproteobacteria bacterium]|nr:zeta toxin family protein [Deltaproteobacteria bacterium]